MKRPIREEISNWLLSAEESLNDGKILLKEGRNASATYFAQQAAEKALKGAVLHFRRRLVKNHSLVSLYRYVKNYVSLSSKVTGELGVLTTAYTGTRYPDVAMGVPEEAYSQSVAERSLYVAGEVVRCVKEAIGL